MHQKQQFRMMPRQFNALPYAGPPAVMHRPFGSYFSPVLWQILWHQAARYRYWLQSAAIAYGLASALLLSVLAGLMATTLSPDIKTLCLHILAQGMPTAVSTFRVLIEQTTAEWRLVHRWWGLGVGSFLALGIWLKVMGTAQLLIRHQGQRRKAGATTFRRKITTLILAVISFWLVVLAYSFVFAAVPGIDRGAIAASPLRFAGSNLLVRLLRWSLAFSTISLFFGLLFRCNQKPSPLAQPVLPGTLLASVLWLIPAMLLKVQVVAFPNHHWLYGLFSTATLGLFCLYGTATGLLLGGTFNKLLNDYFPRSRSPQSAHSVPPPSFDAFTIQRRSNRKDF